MPFPPPRLAPVTTATTSLRRCIGLSGPKRDLDEEGGEAQKAREPHRHQPPASVVELAAEAVHLSGQVAAKIVGLSGQVAAWALHLDPELRDGPPHPVKPPLGAVEPH